VYLAKVVVTLRKSILDPPGKAVHHALASLGLGAVQEVRMGKFLELKIQGTSEDEVRQIVVDACRKLLANPVMEDYSITIEKL
jgi:phosphoribosylformylglycinamidine synthase PurS subunit